MDPYNPPNQKVKTISEEQFRKVTDCLNDLAAKLHVTALLLVDSTGQILAKKNQSNLKMDQTLIATLAASSYAAAREMARISGEKKNFQMVLYEGETQNLFISSIDKNCFLMVVFEKGVALGMVRLFTKRTILQLTPLLAEHSKEETETNQIFTDQFQRQLDQELDQSFKEFE